MFIYLYQVLVLPRKETKRLILSINNCVPYCSNDKKEYAYDK